MNKGGHPNIILILADDMGYSDLACYGGEIDTPCLDRLAGSGQYYTDFYCSPRCCPSRASLLTGMTPHRAGVGWMQFDWKEHCADDADGYRGTLNRNCPTLAERLRDAGYVSYHTGKWHLTADLADKTTWPRARGFDHAFSLIAGATPYYNPRELTLDDKFYLPPEGAYYTDLIGDYGIRFLEEHHEKFGENPFFMYTAFTAPHTPLQAPEEVTARYRSVYRQGWDILRQERYDRMVDKGIIKPEWKLPSRPEGIPSWDSLSGEEKERQVNNMATYAAMVEIMDSNIGRIVEKLDETGDLENTLIMFLSDNGACAEGPLMGSETHYGECWAHLSNTPYQLYKHYTMQGGVQTPFIAHWPGGIKTGGPVRKWTGCLYDVVPACLELAGLSGDSLPETLDGVSFAPILREGDKGTEKVSSRDIFIEHEGNQMVRSGRYKMVRQHSDEYRQLYDMDADRTELNNLADDKREIYTDLCRRYDEWEQSALVLPWERVGRYMDYRGFADGPEFHGRFARALGEADKGEIVQG